MAERAGTSESWKAPIGVETLERAILVGEYYKAHAQHAFTRYQDPKLIGAKYILDWVVNKKIGSFKARDAFSSHIRAGFADMAAFNEALAELQQRRIIRIEPAPPRDPDAPEKRGRDRTPTVVVNPLWLAEAERTAHAEALTRYTAYDATSDRGDTDDDSDDMPDMGSGAEGHSWEMEL
jgi:hypothetical protein